MTELPVLAEQSVVDRFGAVVANPDKAKPDNPAISRALEDQIRASLEGLLQGVAALEALAQKALRGTCSDIWVIDCSPEGHMPDIQTRIF